MRSGRTVDEGQVIAEFWEPGRDPEHNAQHEASPDHVAPCTFDPRSRRWTAEVDTTGWPSGVWTLRGRVITGPDLVGLGWGRLAL